MKKNITIDQYKNLDDAYKYFNEKLFDNKLPECLITLHRKGKAGGYYWHEKYENRENTSQKVSELALNPDYFKEQSDLDILAILVHEMVHNQQAYFGDPPRKGYHNWEFANMMEDVGLMTSSTGLPGGKRVSQSMSHYIIEGGKFEKVATSFLLSGNKFYWNSIVESKEAKERKKTREKFCCPNCLQSAMAKKTAKLMCGVCEIHMIIESE